MKKMHVILMVLFINTTILAQQTSSYAKYDDKQCYLLADNVNIRSAPSTSAKVVANLPIASKLIITEVSPITLKLNGYETNWLKIKFYQNGKMNEGYVWGGLVASECKTAPQDDNLLFLYGVERYNESEYDLILQVRVAKNNKQLAKKTAEGVGSLTTFNTMNVTKNKGVEGIDNIIQINMSDEMCAGAFGDIIMFWHNNTLSYIITMRDGFDAPYFSDEEFIYPEDEKGEAGKIIFTSQSGYYEDDNIPMLEKDERKEFKWDGSKLVEIKN